MSTHDVEGIILLIIACIFAYDWYMKILHQDEEERIYKESYARFEEPFECNVSVYNDNFKKIVEVVATDISEFYVRSSLDEWVKFSLSITGSTSSENLQPTIQMFIHIWKRSENLLRIPLVDICEVYDMDGNSFKGGVTYRAPENNMETFTVDLDFEYFNKNREHAIWLKMYRQNMQDVTFLIPSKYTKTLLKAYETLTQQSDLIYPGEFKALFPEFESAYVD
jgi:hypothetical protein